MRSDSLRLPRGPVRRNWQHPHSQGLLGWWPGTDIADMRRQITGRGVGRLDDGSTRVPMPANRFGRGLQFDGSSTWLHTSATPTAVRITTPLVSVWLRSDVASAVDATIRQPLGFTSNAVTANGGMQFAITHSSDSFDNSWAFNNGSWRSNSYTAVTQAGRWYHLVSAVVTSTDWRIYRDGRKDATVTTAGVVDTTKMATLGLGAVPIVGLNSPWPGQLFDLRVYDASAIADVDAFVASLYDPATRWSLFRGTERAHFIPAAAGGATIPIFAHHYNQTRAA